ncbi:hypothetical protein E4L98_14105 [Duganella callida]|uniref:Histidine kinase/HSP90-like ATPase domain-containing protein n=1 Tax=Duganella callida TaxID=2561932 RepID=A0A4Y9SD25_9BURK|nr:hypothetical protein E4L98_14105 [Duganella callida]
MAAILLFQQAQALNPGVRLEDLNHVSWSEKDGVPSDIQGMAQTRDGWLWLSTMDGLYRFDGLSFERVPLKRNRIYSVHALDNGDLLVSYELEGLSVIHPDGKVEDLADPAGQKLGSLGAMGMDRAGAIWAVSTNGLYRYAHGQWQLIGGGPDWAGRTLSLVIDQYDRVWASTDRGLYRYERDSGQLLRVVGEHFHGGLMQSPDGRLWVGQRDAVYPVPMPATGQSLPRQPEFNQAESRTMGQFDRDGNLWALACPIGVCRVARAGNLHDGAIIPSRQASGRLDQSWQLSNLSANAVLEDREGNIWIATNTGLDRFRENKLVPVRIPAPSGNLSLAGDSEGRLWAAEWRNRALWRVHPDDPPLRDPGRTVSTVATDRDGALLLAGPRDIERLRRGQSSRIALPMPGGQPTDLNVLGLLDDGKVLWMASIQTGLLGWVDGKWLPRSAFNLPKRIFMSAAAGPGQLWLSHNDGGLTFYDNGQQTRYDIAVVGQESGIFPGTQLIVAGEHGLAVLRGGKFEALAPFHAEALRNVSGLAVTPEGDRWLNGARGVVHVRRADWEAAMRDPRQPLAYEVIDALEGYPGRAAMENRLQTIYNAGNGQLWFRTSGGIVRLDTATLRLNTVKPVVQLLRVNSDERSYPANAPLRLPPGVRSFNIQYTAPGLRKPEAMRFQYLLDGVDPHWQDAGTRRAAYYTNIGPGHYTFKVRAVNEDGIVSDAVATLQMDVAPSMTETWWFQLLCAAAALLLLYGLYKYRLRRVTAAMARQLQVRMDERERIARTLHDTFLQSVQALTLRVYAVLTKLPAGSEPRAKLEAILDDADRAIDEGRDQVQQLRSGQDIGAQLDQTGTGLAALQPHIRFELQIEGTPRQLAPPVQEELCAIGQEALRNAFQHARAARITVRIDYRDEVLSLRVADDGRGIDNEEVRQRLRERHFGMVGMRERARRVGASIDISSAPGQGTVVELRAAARLAYVEQTA